MRELTQEEMLSVSGGGLVLGSDYGPGWQGGEDNWMETEDFGDDE